jgi:hypothetical protein
MPTCVSVAHARRIPSRWQRSYHIAPYPAFGLTARGQVSAWPGLARDNPVYRASAPGSPSRCLVHRFRGTDHIAIICGTINNPSRTAHSIGLVPWNRCTSQCLFCAPCGRAPARHWCTRPIEREISLDPDFLLNEDLVQISNLAETGLCFGCFSCGEYGIPHRGRGVGLNLKYAIKRSLSRKSGSSDISRSVGRVHQRQWISHSYGKCGLQSFMMHCISFLIIRALIETTMGRYKALIGPRLRACGFAARQTEVTIGVVALNRMLRLDVRRLYAVKRLLSRKSGSSDISCSIGRVHQRQWISHSCGKCGLQSFMMHCISFLIINTSPVSLVSQHADSGYVSMCFIQ